MRILTGWERFDLTAQRKLRLEQKLENHSVVHSAPYQVRVYVDLVLMPTFFLYFCFVVFVVVFVVLLCLLFSFACCFFFLLFFFCFVFYAFPKSLSSPLFFVARYILRGIDLIPASSHRTVNPYVANFVFYFFFIIVFLIQCY